MAEIRPENFQNKSKDKTGSWTCEFSCWFMHVNKKSVQNYMLQYLRPKYIIFTFHCHFIRYHSILFLYYVNIYTYPCRAT